MEDATKNKTKKEEIAEVISSFPYMITIKKIVQSGVNGYGRDTKYIKRLDLLCHVCRECGENDAYEIKGSDCRHVWEKAELNIDLAVESNRKNLPVYG